MSVLEPAAAMLKGQKLQKLMRFDNYNAGSRNTDTLPWAESKFLDQALVARWGYTALCRTWVEPDIMNLIYMDLGLRTNQQAFEVIYNHNNRFELNGALKDSTDAQFINQINRTNGFLVAFENHGPAYMIGNSGKAVPDLKHWSDIAWLQWTDPTATAAAGSGELKYVLRNAIENKDTLNIIDRILGGYREEKNKENMWVPNWPGIDFAADSMRAQALLGTPNGHGVVWLLIEHRGKKLLGHKTVDKVTLFFTDNDERGNQPSLLFHLEDV
jgi:hypothetical protein